MNIKKYLLMEIMLTKILIATLFNNFRLNTNPNNVTLHYLTG